MSSLVKEISKELLDFVKDNYVTIVLGTALTGIISGLTWKYKVSVTKRAFLDNFKEYSEFPLPKEFINRTLEQSIYETLWSETQRVPIIHGNHGTGVTTLVRSIFNRSKKEGHMIHLVNCEKGNFLYHLYQTFKMNTRYVGKPSEIMDLLSIWFSSPSTLITTEETEDRMMHWKVIVSDLLSRVDLHVQKVLIIENPSCLIKNQQFEEFVLISKYFQENRNFKILFACDNQEVFDYLMEKNKEKMITFQVQNLDKQEVTQYAPKKANLSKLDDDQWKIVQEKVGFNISNLNSLDFVLQREDLKTILQLP